MFEICPIVILLRIYCHLFWIYFQAEEMVKLSKNLSQKIKDKQGDITEDEVISYQIGQYRSNAL